MCNAVYRFLRPRIQLQEGCFQLWRSGFFPSRLLQLQRELTQLHTHSQILVHESHRVKVVGVGLVQVEDDVERLHQELSVFRVGDEVLHGHVEQQFAVSFQLLDRELSQARRQERVKEVVDRDFLALLDHFFGHVFRVD